MAGVLMTFRSQWQDRSGSGQTVIGSARRIRADDACKSYGSLLIIKLPAVAQTGVKPWPPLDTLLDRGSAASPDHYSGARCDATKSDKRTGRGHHRAERGALPPLPATASCADLIALRILSSHYSDQLEPHMIRKFRGSSLKRHIALTCSVRKSPSSEQGSDRRPRRRIGPQHAVVAVAMDVLRCLLSEAHGNQVTVGELVGWVHSMKNELIIASRTVPPRKNARERAGHILREFQRDELQSRFIYD